MQEAQGVGTGGAAAARRAHGEQVVIRVLRRLGAVAPDLAEQHGRRRQVAAVGTRGDRVVKCCELRALASLEGLQLREHPSDHRQRCLALARPRARRDRFRVHLR